jgi:hypothetical protein
MRGAVAACCVALLAACSGGAATSTVSRVRFANRGPVSVVDDRRDVPSPPARREHTGLRAFDIAVAGRLDRVLRVPVDEGALGVNSLDEVPDSTWFENRIGARAVSAEQTRRGPGDGLGPDLSRPLRVIRAKTSGQIPGFIAEDAAGVRWMIKLQRDECSTDVTAQRLLWLAGYHVPENHVRLLARAQVEPGDAADAVFARVTPDAGDRYRVLASRMLPGKPLGGAPSVGRRRDDPNDTIPHERRRELRGLYVFAAWLQHTDFKEPGTLDMWTEDPVDPRRHVVMHYLVDFGNTLGLYARAVRADDGHVEKVVDLDHVRSLLSFGLWKRPWEGTRDPDLPGVGRFDAAHFDPGGFSPLAPYEPFLRVDARDGFWAVAILLRITPAHIRAALEAAQYQDARARAYLTDVLVARQRATARYWFARVSPLAEPSVDGDERGRDRVCFVDLAVAHGLAAPGATRYDVAVTGWDGDVVQRAVVGRGGRGGRTCLAGLARGATHDGYTIVQIVVRRGPRALPALELHLATGPAGQRRIIGVERR